MADVRLLGFVIADGNDGLYRCTDASNANILTTDDFKLAARYKTLKAAEAACDRLKNRQPFEVRRVVLERLTY